MKRTMILMALLMVTVLVLSAPMVEAKKRHPDLNKVRCPNSTSDNVGCDGTRRNDYLIGGPASRSPYGATDYIYGEEGDDVYKGGNGADVLTDNSTKSNDRYLFPSTEFSLPGPISLGFATIQDFGGSADVLNLSSYKSTDFAWSHFYGNTRTLHLDGPGARDINVYDFFTTNSIDSFKFSDRTITADEVKKELL
jgi:Ca2+-binding RTX toxin-like protein